MQNLSIDEKISYTHCVTAIIFGVSREALKECVIGFPKEILWSSTRADTFYSLEHV